MGVIAIKNESDVWGAASRLIYDILVFSIERVGEKNYLLSFKAQFDHGYKSIDLYELSDSDYSEFIYLVKEYVSSERFNKFEYKRDDVEKLIEDLIKRMEDAEMDRVRKTGIS